MSRRQTAADFVMDAQFGNCDESICDKMCPMCIVLFESER